MKIGYLVTRFDEIGGAQIHVRDMAIRMSEEKHSVIVISGSSIDTQYINEFKRDNIGYININNLKREINIFYDFYAFIKLIRILKRKNLDILSLHSSKAGFLGRIAGKITGTPVLFTAHGFSFSEGVPPLKARLYTLAERLVSFFCPKIINVSKYDKHLALKHKIAPGHKFRVIHNGVNDITEDLRAEPGRQPCRLVMTARFAPPKDHRFLLKVLKKCEDIAWTIDFIGSGPLEEEIKILARNLDLSNRIIFHGQTHKVAEILSQAQLFILITNWEGLPRSIIEALRTGLPIIASKVGGVSELVEHGVNGYLIPRADTRMLHKCLNLLLNDAQIRIDMGKASRKKYENGFTFKKMFDETYKVYKELTNF